MQKHAHDFNQIFKDILLSKVGFGPASLTHCYIYFTNARMYTRHVFDALEKDTNEF